MRKIGVQKIFWDAFEIALSTQTRRLARDIADALGKDADPLLKSLETEKAGVYLFEEANCEDIEALEMRCDQFTPIPGKPHFVTACMEPVVWSANPGGRISKCLFHAANPNPKRAEWTVLNPIVYDGTEYYIQADTNEVYDAAGELCGRRIGNKICAFQVEEEK